MDPKPLVDEMRPLLIKAGLKENEIDRILEKPDAWDRVVVIKRTTFAEYATVRYLRSDEQWDFYELIEANYLEEYQMHARAACKLRKEWKKS